MTIQDFQGVSIANFPDIVKRIQSENPPKSGVNDYLNQLDVKKHDVMDETIRRKKEKDTKKGTEFIEVNRIPLSFQKLISTRAAAFLCGNPIKLISNPLSDQEIKLLNTVNYVWGKTKLDYKMLQLALMTNQETECALLCYWVKVDENDDYWGDSALKGAPYKLRTRMIANSLGDKLYPVFDATGDMIAFGREYSIKNGSNDELHFDLYLPSQTLKGVQTSTGWTASPEANPIGKIPVIYFSQPLPEWYDVQSLIDRLETAMSNNADTIDYSGSPILLLSGEVVSAPDKAEKGKAIKLKEGSKAEYLEMDQSADIVENEQESLIKLIHYLTDTPNISFDEMKSLGHFSIISLKMLFLAPHLKASMKAGGGFGESTQRIINFLKSAVVNLGIKQFLQAASLTITPEFDYFLPKNVQETISFLTDSIGAGRPIMSQETAVRLNPLVEDPDEELVKMANEGSDEGEIITA